MQEARKEPHSDACGSGIAYPIRLTSELLKWQQVPILHTALAMHVRIIDAQLRDPPTAVSPSIGGTAHTRTELACAAGLEPLDYDISRQAVALSRDAAAMLGIPTVTAFPALFAQWRLLCHPDDRSPVETALRASIAQRKSFLIDCRLRSCSNPRLWRQVVLRGHASLQSGRHRLLGVIIDVSKHHMAQERLRESTAMLRHVVQSAPGLLYTFDLATGREEHLNRGFANDFATGPVRAIGACMHPDDLQLLEQHRAQYANLPDHEQAHLRFRLRRRDGEYRWFTSRDTVLLRDDDGRVGRVLCSALDVTDWRVANDALHALTAGMLRTQDAERRRIARDLHDSTAQNLLAATLALRAAQLGRTPIDQIDAALALIQQSQQEIRTLSYLLHPPLLDEIGLRAALGWYITGYQERTGITTRLAPAQDGATCAESSLPKETEIILFRVVQEALTNTYRHAQARLVTISLDVAETPEQRPALTVTVTDDGSGLPARRQGGGVGLVGMRERLRLIGGSLTIMSVPGGGTTIRASCPTDTAATDQGMSVPSDAA